MPLALPLPEVIAPCGAQMQIFSTLFSLPTRGQISLNDSLIRTSTHDFEDAFLNSNFVCLVLVSPSPSLC